MGLFGRSAPRRPGRVLLASGVRIDLTDRKVVARASKYRQGWQEQAYAMHDVIGELRYAHDYLGNACSRMRLFPAVMNPDDPGAPPIPLADAKGVNAKLAAAASAALERLGVGRMATAALLNPLAVNFEIAGEAFLFGRQDPDTGQETWQIRSVDELISADDGYHLRELPTDYAEGQAMNSKPLDPESTFIARLWRPHPRFRALATSPMRAILEPCEELVLLSRGIRAAAKSRSATNGILYVPDELTLTQADESDDNPTADPFMQILTQALTAPILDEGAPSAVVPLVLRGPADLAQALVHIQLDRVVDKTAIETRAELIRRIATGIDLPPEILLGLGDVNHWCQDDQAEILTTRGWLTHHELRVGDTALTLNHDTGLSEWQMVRDIYRAKVVDEPMLSVENRFHSSLTTLNHRWPVLRATTTKTNRILSFDREWTTSGALTRNDRIITGARLADLPTDPKWEDAFVELVGWFFTEGTCRQGGRATRPQVLIGQSHKANPDNVARIRRCLTALYGPAHEGNMPKKGLPRTGDPTPQWREFPEDRGMTLFSLNKAAAAPLLEVAPGRVVSLDFIRELTAPQLEVFIDAAARGDGFIAAGGGRTVNQRSRERLVPVELAGILAGYPTSLYSYLSGGFGEDTQWEVRVGSRPPRASTVGSRVVTYAGTVWCPVTANTTWLARRDGKVFYTGNSAFQISDEAFRAHVEPKVITLVDALTEGYLWAALAADGFAPEEYRTISVWYDPVELVTHPDRTADALQLWDRLAISDEALRAAAGFADTDRPTGLELVQRLIGHVRTFPPNVLEAIIHRVDPTLDIPADKAEPGYGPGGELEPIEGGQPADPTPPGQGPPPLPKADSQPPATAIRPVRALTAAAPPTPHRAGAQLADADRDLLVRLHTAAEAEMRRELERAGARVRTKVRASKAHADAIRDATNLTVCATLGETAVVAAGGVLDPSWSDLHAHWAEWVAATAAFARGRASRLVADLCRVGRARLGRCTVSESDLDVLARRQAGHAADGWAWLEAALTSAFRRALYSPAPGGGPVELGGRQLVPLGLVREALALAGGQSAAGDAVSLPRVPYGGVAVSADVFGLLGEFGVAPASWEWRHGGTGEPFEPHLELDGLTFSGPDDPRLVNTESFPGSDRLYPGDHGGCGCVWAPQLVAEPAELVAA